MCSCLFVFVICGIDMDYTNIDITYTICIYTWYIEIIIYIKIAHEEKHKELVYLIMGADKFKTYSSKLSAYY